MEQGTPTPVVITAYSDRSFSFETKTPPASWYLRKAANVAKGSKVPNRDKVGKVTMAQVREIAEAKMKDLNANDIDAAAKIIAGSARSMGIDRSAERRVGKECVSTCRSGWPRYH